MRNRKPILLGIIILGLSFGAIGVVARTNQNLPWYRRLFGALLNSPAEPLICISDKTQKSLTLQQALSIAQRDCGQIGRVDTGKERSCNSITGTWWLGLIPYEPKTGCNPACVVFIDTQKAEVNWRCTGLIPTRECVWCGAKCVRNTSDMESGSQMLCPDVMPPADYECKEINGTCTKVPITNNTCGKEGEKVNRNPGMGPTDKQCCPGLTEIKVSKSYSICVNCGDGICKNPENVSNCPKDCPQKVFTIPRAIIIEKGQEGEKRTLVIVQPSLSLDLISVLPTAKITFKGWNNNREASWNEISPRGDIVSIKGYYITSNPDLPYLKDYVATQIEILPPLPRPVSK